MLDGVRYSTKIVVVDILLETKIIVKCGNDMATGTRLLFQFAELEITHLFFDVSGDINVYNFWLKSDVQ
jgi:hypothetical protein